MASLTNVAYCIDEGAYVDREGSIHVIFNDPDPDFPDHPLAAYRNGKVSHRWTKYGRYVGFDVRDPRDLERRLSAEEVEVHKGAYPEKWVRPSKKVSFNFRLSKEGQEAFNNVVDKARKLCEAAGIEPTEEEPDTVFHGVKRYIGVALVDSDHYAEDLESVSLTDDSYQEFVNDLDEDLAVQQAYQTAIGACKPRDVPELFRIFAAYMAGEYVTDNG